VVTSVDPLYVNHVQFLWSNVSDFHGYALICFPHVWFDMVLCGPIRSVPSFEFFFPDRFSSFAQSRSSLASRVSTVAGGSRVLIFPLSLNQSASLLKVLFVPRFPTATYFTACLSFGHVADPSARISTPAKAVSLLDFCAPPGSQTRPGFPARETSTWPGIGARFFFAGAVSS
jgi:hypothetical protein